MPEDLPTPKKSLKELEKEQISQEEKREIAKKIIGNLKRGEAKKIYLTDVK